MAFNFVRPRFGSSKVPWFVSDTLPTGEGGGIEPLTADDTVDLSDLAAGGVAAATITVTGAAIGDGVIINPGAAAPAGVVLEARVSAADTVAYRAQNLGSSALPDPTFLAITILVIPSGTTPA